MGGIHSSIVPHENYSEIRHFLGPVQKPILDLDICDNIIATAGKGQSPTALISLISLSSLCAVAELVAQLGALCKDWGGYCHIQQDISLQLHTVEWPTGALARIIKD